MQLASLVTPRKTAIDQGSSLVETIVALCVVCIGVEGFFRSLSANRVLQSQFTAEISTLRTARTEYLNVILPALETAPQSEHIRCADQKCYAADLDLILAAFPESIS